MHKDGYEYDDDLVDHNSLIGNQIEQQNINVLYSKVRMKPLSPLNIKYHYTSALEVISTLHYHLLMMMS